MNKDIEFIKDNLKDLSYKRILELVEPFQISLNTIEDIKILSNILKTDKRKNIKTVGDKLLKQSDKLIREYNRVKAMYDFDKSYGEFKYIAGVDEVGRGPLAGPIVAAAVVLNLNDLDDILLEINDSKVLKEETRNRLSDLIKEKAVSYSIASMSNYEIDEKGIAYCNNTIFINACEGLSVKPDLILSDGYLIKNIKILNKAVIKGDAKSASIACASIIAKVHRDKIMKEFHNKYPEYGFDHNVGYGSKQHIEALNKIGPCEIHRMSFLSNILNPK